MLLLSGNFQIYHNYFKLHDYWNNVVTVLVVTVVVVVDYGNFYFVLFVHFLFTF